MAGVLVVLLVLLVVEQRPDWMLITIGAAALLAGLNVVGCAIWLRRNREHGQPEHVDVGHDQARAIRVGMLVLVVSYAGICVAIGIASEDWRGALATFALSSIGCGLAALGAAGSFSQPSNRSPSENERRLLRRGMAIASILAIVGIVSHRDAVLLPSLVPALALGAFSLWILTR